MTRVERSATLARMTKSTSPSTRLSSSGQPLAKHWVAVVAAIWAGQAFSIISSSAAGYAIVWHVTESTGSAGWLSLMMICSMLPTGLLSPVGGLVADRLNRKIIMIVADLSIGVLSLILGIAMLGAEVSLGVIVAFAAARSVGQAFHSPAFLALVPMLAPEEQLLRLNMLDQLAVSVASMLSPALGIFVFSTFGLPWALFLDTLGAIFAVLGLLVAHVPTVRDAASEHAHILHNLKVGWDALAKNHALFKLLWLMLICWAAMAPIGATFPLITAEHYLGDGFMASIVEACYGGGLVLGSVVLLAWGGGSHLATLIALSYLTVGLLCLPMGYLPPELFWLFLVLNVIAGAFEAGFNGPLMTIVQREVASEQLGRAMGLITAASGVGAPVGVALLGPLGDVIGLPAMFALASLICIASDVIALSMRDIRALDAPSEESAS